MGKYSDSGLLKKASKDLFYEVVHLIELFLLLKENENNEIKKHACLESLLIHARNIFYFLFNEYNSKQPDDVLALNYFNDSKEWVNYKKTQQKKEIFVGFKKRISKEIAHLSFKRIKNIEDNNNWDLHFVIDLIEGIDKFFSLVQPELIDSCWLNYKTIRNKLDSDKDNFLFNMWVFGTN